MGNLFNIDNPVMAFLSKVADLMILNLLTLVCCIPVFTIGASFSAMHFALLRVRRDESTYVTKDFFHAFKKNFKDATALWGCYFLVGAFLAFDCYLVFRTGLAFTSTIKYLLAGIAVLLLISMTWGFALVARYENTLRQTLINSFFIAFGNLGKTILMVILMVLPFALAYLFPITIPVILLLGFTLSGYLRTRFYGKVFEKLEAANIKNEEMDP